MVTIGTGRMALSLLLLLFLGSVSRVLAQAGGEPGARGLSPMNGPNSKVTVFWFEDLSRPGQEEQARQIGGEIRRRFDGSNVRFIEVVKEPAGAPPPISPPGTSTGGWTISLLSFSDLYWETIHDAAAQSGLSSHGDTFGLQRLGMVLLDRKGRMLVREAPLSLSEVMNDVRTAAVVTKVDESTWGKIKELFR